MDTPAPLEQLENPARARLEVLCDAVRASPHNLMSPRALDALWSRHIPECLALAGRLPSELEWLADVGSGGGFPGLVIAVARPEVRTTLIESTTKKARFLRETARRLGLERVRVLDVRVEDLHGTEEAGRYDALTARAVAPLRQLIPWTLPLLDERGLLYAVKGAGWESDLQEARDALGRDAFCVVGRPRPRHDEETAEPRVVTIGRPPEAGPSEGRSR